VVRWSVRTSKIGKSLHKKAARCWRRQRRRSVKELRANDDRPIARMSKVRVALFPGQGLDTFRLYVVDEETFVDSLVTLFGAKQLDADIISPVHALYKPVGPATHPDWFAMVRDNGTNGELVDLPESDCLELPRMLAKSGVRIGKAEESVGGAQPFSARE